MKGRETTVRVGDVFGRWAVVGPAERDGSGRRRWACLCTCGSVKDSLEDNLKRGATKSCGCLSSETTSKRNTTHGLSHEPLFQVWNSLMQRCYNPGHPSYADYGARGDFSARQVARLHRVQGGHPG